MSTEVINITENINLINVQYYDIGLGIIVIGNERKVIIDAATSDLASKLILPMFKKLGITSIDKIILTHGDHDHVGGVVIFKKFFRPKILASKETENYTKDPVAAFRKRFGYAIKFIPQHQLEDLEKGYYAERGEGFTIDEYLYENSEIKIDDTTFFILNMEGHIDGALGFYNKELRMLICGDSIQGEGPKSQLFSPFPMYNNVEKYQKTLEQVKLLDLDIIICAHPYLPCHTPIVKGKMVKKLLEKSSNIIALINNLVLEGIYNGKNNLKDIANYVCTEMKSELTLTALMTIKAHLDYLCNKSIIRWINIDNGIFEIL